MKNIYVSSACLPEKKMKEVVRKLASNGLKNIELSGGTVFDEEMESDLLRIQDEFGVKYAVHGYFPPPRKDFVINLASLEDEIYEKSLRHYEDSADLFERLGCTDLSIHAGFLVGVNSSQIGGKLSMTKIYEKEKATERFCKGYSRIENIMRNRGITVYLENNVISQENYKAFGNNNFLLMTDYETILEIKSIINFNFLLDLGHLFVSCNTLGLDYKEQINKMRSFVKWVHLSDNDGIFDEHRPLRTDSEIAKTYFTQLLDKVDNVTLEMKAPVNELYTIYEAVQKKNA